MVESKLGEAVSCSICFDVVVDGERSRAKLKCGHLFHLDCIGSSFNMKGSMQCPTCRTVEKGHWLYANDVAQTVTDVGVGDWIPDQDEPSEPAFPVLTFGVHWCPFGGLARYRSVLEDMDTSSAMYQWVPEHSLLAQQTAAFTVSHSYPTYTGQPPLSSATDSIEDTVFNNDWNVIPHGDLPVPHAFPAMCVQYQSWIHYPPSTNSHVEVITHAPNPVLLVIPLRGEPGTRSRYSTHAPLPRQMPAARTLCPFLPTDVPLAMDRSYEAMNQVPASVFQQTVIHPVQRIQRHYGYGRSSVLPITSLHNDQNGSHYVTRPAMRNIQEVQQPVQSHVPRWDFFPSSFPERLGLNWHSLQEATGRYDSGWQRHWS